jgi:hypothetical protein
MSSLIDPDDVKLNAVTKGIIIEIIIMIIVVNIFLFMIYLYIFIQKRCNS